MGAQPGAPPHPIRTLLLDLDDTLYQVEEIPELVRRAIHDYMEQKLAIPKDQIAPTCLEYYTTYGTTMAGLVEKGYQIDFDDWHAAVHGTLPYQRLLKRDEGLRQLLQSIPLPKYVFTNADRKHADTCLELMGVADLFEGIICFESLMETGRRTRHVMENKPVVCKPNQLAFEMALRAAGADAATSVFCDDSTRNVKAARAAGIFSVLVGRCGADCGADLEVPNLAALRQALPGLWQHPSCSSSIHLPPGTSTPDTARGVPPVAKGQGVQEEQEASASGQLLEESRSQEITVAAGK